MPSKCAPATWYTHFESAFNDECVGFESPASPRSLALIVVKPLLQSVAGELQPVSAIGFFKPRGRRTILGPLAIPFIRH